MTKDDILMMARNSYGIYAFTAEDLSKFAELIVQGEREACAKVAEEGMLLTCKNGAFHKLDGTESTEGLDKRIGSAIAEAIRARGKK